MKKIALLGLVFIFIGVFLMRMNDISTIIDTLVATKISPVTLDSRNEYYRDYDFEFVQNTDDFAPKSRQDILNIYYTVLNAGKTKFTFYCPKEYEGCLDEVEDIANDQDELSDINNYTHPYNGFSHIETEFDSLGKVTLSIVNTYSYTDIERINQKIDEILPQLTNEANSVRTNIKNIHDYIINNTKYDSDKAENRASKYRSDVAYGPLFQGYAVCGGYTDLMELFLERLGVKSYKVSSDSHVWNAVLVDNVWYHLDLTWDDPVASDGTEYLEHDYFLISTPKLSDLDTTQHTFNQNVYKELKEA